MELIKKLLLWLVGIFFVMTGISLFTLSYKAAISVILASLFLIPASTEFFYKKTTISIKPKIKFLIVSGLLISAPILVNQEEKERDNAIAAAQAEAEAKRKEAQEMQSINAIKKHFFENKESVISSLKSDFENKNYEAAISNAEKYMITGNTEVIDIYKNAKSALNAIQIEKRTKELLEKAKKLPSSETEENKNLYQQLVSMNPNNEKFKEKLSYYADKLQKKQKEEKEKAAAKLEREEKIKSQFHPWDGSHIQLERMIKQQMNDPNSYEHVETVYWDNDAIDSLIVQTTFRGKNAFGGVVKNFVKVRVNLNGDIIEVIDQS